MPPESPRTKRRKAILSNVVDAASLSASLPVAQRVEQLGDGTADSPGGGVLGRSPLSCAREVPWA